ncbi:hypothetical protein KIW84_034486 [Lathyrus oleraceus]|uniref:Uncharacterized protein n=1 Tax=Pisum sativum TaxID=3888 RepID=A0A9D5B4L8_PEA|nr:hypothetical protein KIW84_034486 [Pisum sativum]
MNISISASDLFCNLVSRHAVSFCMHVLLSREYKEDLEPERSLRLRRRLLLVTQHPVKGIPIPLIEDFGEIQVKEADMAETSVIGIANDRARNIRYYAVFDPNAMNTGIFILEMTLETFYNGLVPSSRNMLDTSSGGALLSKSYQEAYSLIESIITKTYQWPVTKVVARTTQKNPTGIHEISETITLVAQVAEIHKMMKNMISSPDVTAAEPEKIVTALSSRTLRSLPSTTETPASASGSKNFETCKVIKLRSRKDVETTDKNPSHSRDDLSTPSSLEELNKEEEKSL